MGKVITTGKTRGSQPSQTSASPKSSIVEVPKRVLEDVVSIDPRILVARTPTGFSLALNQDTGDLLDSLAELQEVDFERIITVNKTVRMTATAVLGKVHIVLEAGAVHVPGEETHILIPANTVSDPVDLVTSDDLQKSSWETFDPTKPFLIVIHAVSTTGVVSAARVIAARDLVAPTLSSVTVSLGISATQLVLLFNKATLVPDLVGQVLSWTSGTQRTITGIASVSDDNLTWTYNLSGAVSEGNVFSLVIGSDRTIRGVRGGVKIAPVTMPVTVVPEAFDYSTLTGIRFFMDPALSANVTSDGGAVTQITEEINSYVMTGTCTYRTTGIGGRPALEGNGTSDVMETTVATVADLMDLDGFYMGIVVQAIALDTNSATVYINDAACCDSVGWLGIFFKQAPTAHAYHFDVGVKEAPPGGTAISLNTPTLLTFRYDGTNIYLGKNGVESAGVAVANLTNSALTALWRLFRASGGGGSFTNLRIARHWICDHPNPPQRAQAEADAITYYGIAA